MNKILEMIIKERDKLLDYSSRIPERTGRIDECSTSPLNEGYDQTKDNPDTYITRQTGRTANRILEYVYWRLRAIQDEKAFKCTYQDFIFKDALLEVPAVEKRDMGLPQQVEAYPFNSGYYKNHKEFIKEILGFKQRPLKYDCVFHLRLDDVSNNCFSYTLIPFLDYIRFFKDVEVSDIIIIGKPIDEFQYQYAKFLKKLLQVLKPNIHVKLELNNSVEKDLDIIASCRILVASTSTFWFWHSFLSDNIECVYYPSFGVVNCMKLENIPEWKSFDLNLFPPKKVYLYDLHRLFL